MGRVRLESAVEDSGRAAHCLPTRHPLLPFEGHVRCGYDRRLKTII